MAAESEGIMSVCGETLPGGGYPCQREAGHENTGTDGGHWRGYDYHPEDHKTDEEREREVLTTAVRWMVDMRVQKLCGGAYTIELHPSAFVPAPQPETKPAPAPVGVENGGEPTDEQLLMWSAGGPLPKAQPDEVES